jgi:cytochrome c oxidase assembly factor CtaG
MDPARVPLTWLTALTSWHLDIAALALIVGAGLVYGWATRRASARHGSAWWFFVGIALLAVASVSAIAVYATVVFWVRAAQVLLLLYIAPFCLAMGRPVTVLSQAAEATDRVARALAARVWRVLLHPVTTSVAMLATPWLLYLTPWYVAALQYQAVGFATSALLVVIGFGYYHARLQADPVPRRYSQLISVVISIVESLGDGLLGIVLWLGPLIAVGYYSQVGRTWGPTARVDQSIGAGVLWILGDVFGVGFIVVLMRLFSADEKTKAAVVDAELDMPGEDMPRESGLWWENDPQLRERMRRS